MHSHQLEWSDEEVPPLLRVVNRHPNLVTQMELKEALYNDIVHYFNNAKVVIWMHAISDIRAWKIWLWYVIFVIDLV